MNLTLLGAAIAAVLWILLAWVVPVGIPAVHLLLALAATLFVRGWALTH